MRRFDLIRKERTRPHTCSLQAIFNSINWNNTMIKFRPIAVSAQLLLAYLPRSIEAG